MKVALISTNILSTPPEDYGGLELVVALLARGLVERGHDVTVFAKKGSHVDGATIRELRGANDLESYKEYAPELAEFDVVHTHGWLKAEYFWKRGHPDARIMATHHGMQPPSATPPSPKPCWVGISKSQAFIFEESWSVHVPHVYNGIDVESYPFRERKEDYVLFLSRMMPAKGAHVAAWLAERTGTRVLIAGGSFGDTNYPGYVDAVKKMCEESKGHAEWVGVVSHEKKKELLAGARALLSPLITHARWPAYGDSFWWEPFGLHLVEALACGTPVLTTYNGATPEIVEDGLQGWLCPGLRDLEAKMTDLGRGPTILHSPTVIAQELRSHAEHLFSYGAMTEGYLELYERLRSGQEW